MLGFATLYPAYEAHAEPVMTNDPIVEEIHRIREQLSQKYNNDLHAICEAARRAQEASGRKVVHFPSKRIPKPVRP